MRLKRVLPKRWRYGLAFLVALVLLSRLHVGTIELFVSDPYDQQRPVKVLSRQLLLHPFANQFKIQWKERPKCDMTLIYMRSTRSIIVDCYGAMPDPYVISNLSELEIHRLGFSDGGLRHLERTHPPQYVYDPKTGKENPEVKLPLLD